LSCSGIAPFGISKGHALGMHRLGFQRGKCPPCGDICLFEIPNGAFLGDICLFGIPNGAFF